MSGTDLSNGSFFTDTIVLDAANYNFNTGNRFRIRCDASGNNDQVFFDQIIISGDNPTAQAVAVIDENVSRLTSFNNAAEDNIKLYPNPTSTQITIEVKEVSYSEIMIFSTTGQLMTSLEPSEGNLTIDVSEYASGMYFIRFVSNGLAVTKRFIKQ